MFLMFVIGEAQAGGTALAWHDWLPVVLIVFTLTAVSPKARLSQGVWRRLFNIMCLFHRPQVDDLCLR